MAYTGTIVTEAEITLMSGENVDATGATETNNNFLSAHAEAYLSGFVQYDIVTNWATINVKTRALFTEWAARYCGMTLIAYNMITWHTNTSIIEAEDLIQTHIFRMEKIEEILAKLKTTDFLGTS